MGDDIAQELAADALSLHVRMNGEPRQLKFLTGVGRGGCVADDTSHL